MAKVMKKDKDGFRHVTNPGASQADINRGHLEGMAEETLDICPSLESAPDYVDEEWDDEQGKFVKREQKGFLDRGERSRQWER